MIKKNGLNNNKKNESRKNFLLEIGKKNLKKYTRLKEEILYNNNEFEELIAKQKNKKLINDLIHLLKVEIPKGIKNKNRWIKKIEHNPNDLSSDMCYKVINKKGDVLLVDLLLKNISFL